MTMIGLAKAAEIAEKNIATLRHAITAGHLPAIKIGKSWAVSRADLQKWIDDPARHTPGVKAK